MVPPKRSHSVATKVDSDILRLNAILHGLDRSRIDEVIAQAALVDLPVRREIYQPKERIDDVYFPLTCVLSIVSRMTDGHMIEVGTIGREGTSAIPLLFGATTSANESYCQVPGYAIKLSAELFSSLLEDATFRSLLDRYLQAYVNMLGQLAACNCLHTIYERCARWLLMTQDRVNSTEIPLTHEYLAMMLGTERSGVSLAAGALQNAGFISYAHGKITIRDQAGLESSACECYAVAREQFGGLLRSVKSRRGEELLAGLKPPAGRTGNAKRPVPRP